jgi:hypothetical protein
MRIVQITPEEIDYEEDNEDYKTQRSSMVTLTQDPKSSKYYKTQPGITSLGSTKTYLGPNEVFFNSKKRISCRQSGKSDDDLNQKKNFSSITGLEHTDDVMYWPFLVDKKCIGILHCSANINKGSEGAIFTVSVDGKNATNMLLDEEIDPECYAWSCKIKRLSPGYHFVEIKISGITNTKKGIGSINYLKLVTKHPTLMVRERWRPLAGHASLKSSQTGNVDAWVVSVHKESPMGSSYNPITTPYGYFGTSIGKNGEAGGVNFSLWSFGRGAQPPPTHQLSRILAIGHPTATFSHFSHEGTGVKIRNYTGLWDGNDSQKYVFAMRMAKDPQDYSDGQVYVYCTYIWDEANKKWKLYGIGKKFNKKKINSLSIGSFVEIPGPAQKERTNHVKRRVYYKGYSRVKSSGDWNQLDTFNPALNKHTTKFVNKEWGQENGYFYTQVGGLAQNDMSLQSDPISLERDEESLVESDIPEWLEHIDQMEKPIEFPEIVSYDTENSKLTLSINIPESNSDTDTNSNEVHVYTGNSDGLTIAKTWDNVTKLKNVPNGFSNVSIPYPTSKKYCRILVRNSKMQIWSFSTSSL